MKVRILRTVRSEMPGDDETMCALLPCQMVEAEVNPYGAVSALLFGCKPPRLGLKPDEFEWAELSGREYADILNSLQKKLERTK